MPLQTEIQHWRKRSENARHEAGIGLLFRVAQNRVGMFGAAIGCGGAAAPNRLRLLVLP